jgi:hypothetical protein
VEYADSGPGAEQLLLVSQSLMRCM